MCSEDSLGKGRDLDSSSSQGRTAAASQEMQKLLQVQQQRYDAPNTDSLCLAIPDHGMVVRERRAAVTAPMMRE